MAMPLAPGLDSPGLGDAVLSPLVYLLAFGLAIVAVGIAVTLPVHYSKVRRADILQIESWSALSIVSFVLAFLVPLAGVVCGHIALSQIKRTRARGWGFAVSALWIGYVNVVTGILVIVVLVSIALALPAFFANLNDLLPNLH
jgi:hypothetical protein